MLALLKNKRVILISLLLIAIASSFWSSSRYPVLQSKAEMTGQISLEDTLTHETIVDPSKDAGTVEKIIYTTINWSWGNKEGMGFAILLATCFLALFNYLPAYRTRNRFLNSLYGMASGTPLGVCVNCVAPISKAMYEGGRSLQTAIALMFSSPSLNIIVLTMLFTFFPPYIAFTKLAFTFLLILGIVPFLSKEDRRDIDEMEGQTCGIAPPPVWDVKEHWGKALIAAVTDLLKSFQYIVIRTVPLMLVAGFLGAVLTHMWDPNTLIGEAPSLLTVIGVSIFGTFLPMPIAFDVMTAQALLAANVPIVIVSTLLFTLGLFSIYSFFIVWKSFSPKLACKLYVIVCVLGVICGYATQFYSDYKSQTRSEKYQELVLNAPDIETLPTTLTSLNSAVTLNGTLETTPLKSKRILDDKALKIDRIIHAERNTGDKPFTMVRADELGIDSYNKLNARNFIEPFLLGRSVASGDFNRDGWVDIATGSPDGFELYQNIDGKRFVKIELNIPEIKGKEGVSVAMVDMNNDDWLDFYVTTFAEGNYLILNPNGKKEAKNVIHLSNKKSLLTNVLSFADINHDGWLDVAHGNWNGGELVKLPGQYARNELFLNEAGQSFAPTLLPASVYESPGNTLSILFSDLNNDSHMDLLASNDYEVPDAFYLGGENGEFQIIGKRSGMIPRSPKLNMSMETADINNDLRPDIYMTGGTYNLTQNSKTAAVIYHDSDYCSNLTDEHTKKKCEEMWLLSKVVLVSEFKECDDMADIYNEEQIKNCMVTQMLHTIKWGDKPCKDIPSSYRTYKQACTAIEASPNQWTIDIDKFVPQEELGNILLISDGEYGFIDMTEEFNVGDGAWSWSGKAADLDNDEWQDIYVANGSVYSAFMGTTTHSPNIFFHNKQGQTFTRMEEEFGLDNWEHSSAFTYVDMDRDGDLDIISNTSFGYGYVYRNNNTTGNSISFELKDEMGNSQCVGCKIFVFYGEDKQKKQMREIKSGGAFMSYDAATAHFGLGDDEEIKQLGIVWSDGKKFTLPHTMPAGSHYVITRPKSAEVTTAN